jgi:hypothetical protein
MDFIFQLKTTLLNMFGQNTNDMVTGKLILKTRKGKELVVNHIHFPMFDDHLAGAYVQYTYDAPEGERPLVGSISKEDIEDIYCQTVKVLMDISIMGRCSGLIRSTSSHLVTRSTTPKGRPFWPTQIRLN